MIAILLDALSMGTITYLSWNSARYVFTSSSTKTGFACAGVIRVLSWLILSCIYIYIKEILHLPNFQKKLQTTPISFHNVTLIEIPIEQKIFLFKIMSTHTETRYAPIKLNIPCLFEVFKNPSQRNQIYFCSLPVLMLQMLFVLLLFQLICQASCRAATRVSKMLPCTKFS